MSSINTLKGNIKAVADAIRYRNGSSETITLAEMPDKIRNINVPTAHDWASSLELNGFNGDVVLPVSDAIRPYAFYNAGYGASNNFNIVIPEGVKRIHDNAFEKCKAKGISIPSTVTRYGEESFLNCSSMTTLNIASTADISNSCFNGCSSLANVSFPEGLKFISYYAFRYCSSLAELELPHLIETVGQQSFESCRKLQSVRFMSDEGILAISTKAFKDCSLLANVWFENKPKSIATDAFDGCTALKTINVSWNEGEVAGAPWGAVNAKIKYRNMPTSEETLDAINGFDGVTSSGAVIYNGDDLREYSEIHISISGIANSYNAPASVTGGSIMPYDTFVSANSSQNVPSYTSSGDYGITIGSVGDAEITIVVNDDSYSWESVSSIGAKSGTGTFRGASSKIAALVYNGMPISAESVTITAIPK